MPDFFLNAYNRNKAINYAEANWNKRPVDYLDYDSKGGDAANFVSQCLREGGLRFKSLSESEYENYRDGSRARGRIFPGDIRVDPPPILWTHRKANIILKNGGV